MAKFLQSVQQPKPIPLKRPFTSLLEDLVDQPSSCPAPKRYRPESVDRFVTQRVEPTSQSETYRERHCRSDNLLGYPDGDLISRRLTKSTPNMVYPAASRLTMPPTPDPFRPRLSINPSDDDSASGGPGRSSGKSLVENPGYRDWNLAANNIYMRFPSEQFPEHVNSLIDRIGRDRHSPGPSVDSVRRNSKLHQLEIRGSESEVQTFMSNEIFHESAGTLQRIENMPMSRHTIPNNSSSKYNVSNPVPDVLFGYDLHKAFPQQQAQLHSMEGEMVGNCLQLLYPFFVIEFKGDGPSGAGSLWVATN